MINGETTNTDPDRQASCKVENDSQNIIQRRLGLVALVVARYHLARVAEDERDRTLRTNGSFKISATLLRIIAI